jgi:hypothetical protein
MKILERKPNGGSLPEQLRRELHQFLRESLGEKRRSSAVRATECAADRQLAEPLEKMTLCCVLPEKQRSLEDLLENMDASFRISLCKDTTEAELDTLVTAIREDIVARYIK